MLMDCMELSRDGTTQWVPRNIANIDHRIKPLLWLEILFPDLCRKFPSIFFGEHNLDFSKKLSSILSITLSAIDDAHVQKPMEQTQVVLDTLVNNDLHHPLVWKRVLECDTVQKRLFDDPENFLTDEPCQGSFMEFWGRPYATSGPPSTVMLGLPPNGGTSPSGQIFLVTSGTNTAQVHPVYPLQKLLSLELNVFNQSRAQLPDY
ncbi:hypothetical protein EDD18DRAFT_1112446 [Armillaria luteobubalina]|uniref:Uncharacterized protein n=1 Tax=Armillaria luteobubalina TaxID=153913 RepID=A0AA39PG35_9AGAR|nr:hypothetical protein EDD18DRAFT_1112446 [Armillaria luteobubalina]